MEILAREIEAGGTVVFESWDGALRGADCDQLIHLGAESAMVLEDRSIGVTNYRGTYSLAPTGLMTVSLEGYPRGRWPALFLRYEQGSLRLHREDGVTAWAPEHPEVKEMDGFWPFRARARSAD